MIQQIRSYPIKRRQLSKFRGTPEGKTADGGNCLAMMEIGELHSRRESCSPRQDLGSELASEGPITPGWQSCIAATATGAISGQSCRSARTHARRDSRYPSLNTSLVSHLVKSRPPRESQTRVPPGTEESET